MAFEDSAWRGDVGAIGKEDDVGVELCDRSADVGESELWVEGTVWGVLGVVDKEGLRLGRGRLGFWRMFRV